MKSVEDLLERRKKVMLSFSAGKDSAVLLELLRPYWEQLTIVWCNQGNPYPETVAYMERVAKMVPNFVCVLGDQPQNVKDFGYPVDVIPLELTAQGNSYTGKPTIKVRPYWDCCGANMWKPMEDFVIRGDYDGVIRGQKQVDPLRNPMPSGTVVNGVEYVFPINDWAEEQISEFLTEKDLWPESYKRGIPTSLDCMNCTAYAAENQGRIKDLESINTQAAVEVATVHTILFNAMKRNMDSLEKCYG